LVVDKQPVFDKPSKPPATDGRYLHKKTTQKLLQPRSERPIEPLSRLPPLHPQFQLRLTYVGRTFCGAPGNILLPKVGMYLHILGLLMSTVAGRYCHPMQELGVMMGYTLCRQASYWRPWVVTEP
jgi:hypothetical protein